MRHAASMTAALVLIAAMVATPFVVADEYTPAELAAGKAERLERIKQVASEIKELEDKRDKSRVRAMKSSFGAEITKKSRELNELKRKTPEDFAEARREAVEADRRKLAATAERLKAEENDNAERMKKSGNCPLKIEFANFAHLTDEYSLGAFHNVDATTTLGFEPITAIVCEVTNGVPQDVEAWEMTYDLLDGFGEVIYSGAHRNPLVHPGEKSRIRISCKHFPEAVQMTMHIARAKLADGTTWERRPEHERVSESVKKLEGADLLKRADQ